MRTALTGATGLVGTNLALELLRQGHSVRATRRGSSVVSHLDRAPIEWVKTDLSDPAGLAAAFEGVDVVFHCAAQLGVQREPRPEMVAANVDGTRNVIDAVRRARATRLVHCSTVAAVGLSNDGRPSGEEAAYNFDERGMVDGYGKTKRAGERLVLDAVRSGLDAVVVNPTWMFGPYDVGPGSGQLIVDVVRGKMPGLAPGRNNFVDVRDVAKGMILAAEKGRAGERYILGGENMTYGEIAQRIARVAGVAEPRWKVPRALAVPAGWLGDAMEALGGSPHVTSVTIAFAYCPDFVFSSEKAKRELGYTTGPLDVAIGDALAWFRASGKV